MVQRILNHNIKMGCTQEAIDGWTLDLFKYHAKRLIYKQSKTKKATYRAKLRHLAQLRHQDY